MMNVKRIVMASVVIAGLASGLGCRSTEPVIGGGEDSTRPRVVENEPQKPQWVNSLGEWEEEWRNDHKGEADRFLWVVGTSQAVESIEREQEAEKSASDQAIFELVRALGIDVDTLGMRTEAWSNETRALVIGAYKEALQTEMARHKVNFKNYAWFNYVVESTGIGGYKKASYIKKGLFHLDKESVVASLAEDTAEEFAKKVKERIKKNADVQKELVDRAKELTKQRMQELMGTK